MQGYIRYLMTVEGKDVAAVYYHNFFCANFWAIEGWKELFPVIVLPYTEIVEIDRSNDMIGFVHNEI